MLKHKINMWIIIGDMPNDSRMRVIKLYAPSVKITRFYFI